jgi:hypothetical protein
MSQQKLITDRILTQIQYTPDCEVLVSSLPELAWQDIFLEVDRLSRTGQVRLTRGSVTNRLRLSLTEWKDGPEGQN